TQCIASLHQSSLRPQQSSQRPKQSSQKPLEIIIKNNAQQPLLSVWDVRLPFIAILKDNNVLIEKEISQMIVRHIQRAYDTIRRYHLSENWVI
ncbi:MAG: hypothetical protein WBO36_14330, partial [Saprospiraceae bacterium]